MAVAEQVGLTKAGVQYHFASRENLMDSIEEAGLSTFGKPLSESMLRGSAINWFESENFSRTGWVLALLAIDGLWLQDALEVPSFSGEQRETIIDAILKLGNCQD